MPLRKKKHFIFDMDGTLTLAVHDFVHIRSELGLPLDKPILESISARPLTQQTTLHDKLYELEIGYAEQAKPQNYVYELLQHLSTLNYSLGILTRNSKQLAITTLNACGLLKYFPPNNIIGRDDAKPKPDPHGITLLMQQWDASAGETAIVGDYYFDLAAGRNANITTVHFDETSEFQWPELTDVKVQSHKEILELLPNPN